MLTSEEEDRTCPNVASSSLPPRSENKKDDVDRCNDWKAAQLGKCLRLDRKLPTISLDPNTEFSKSCDWSKNFSDFQKAIALKYELRLMSNFFRAERTYKPLLYDVTRTTLRDTNEAENSE